MHIYSLHHKRQIYYSIKKEPVKDSHTESFFGDNTGSFPWGVKEVDNHKGDNYPLTDYYYYNDHIKDSFLSVLRLFTLKSNCAESEKQK